mgnify:CR=1 FL=1
MNVGKFFTRHGRGRLCAGPNEELDLAGLRGVNDALALLDLALLVQMSPVVRDALKER